MVSITITVEKLISLLMCAAGLGVSILSLIQIQKSFIEKQVRKFFGLFLWLLILYIAMNLLRLVGEGLPGKPIRVFLMTVTFFDFLTSGLMAGMMAIMLLYSAVPEKAANGVYIRLILGALAVHTALLIVSQFTGLYYFFDESNVYHRSPLYLLSNAIPGLLLALCMYLLLRYRAKFDKPIAAALWIYLLAPLAAMILQGFYPAIKFIILATTGAAVNMFSVLTNDLIRKYEAQQMESSRIETELSMATRIQADMLPSIFPAFPDRGEFDLYASMDPAKEVGGDFYDFFMIDDDHLALVIADVSGKGVPAALFMMASKILIQNYAIMYGDTKAALEATNRQICQSNREEMFVTVWLGILDIRTGILTAANAGHEYPAVKAAGGKFTLFPDKHGFVIGGMPNMKYKPYELKLEPGAMLFLYTDGVAEATNGENELFGTKRMLEALNAAPDADPEQLLRSVHHAVDDFVGEAEQFDDLTMLCIKFFGKRTQEA